MDAIILLGFVVGWGLADLVMRYQRHRARKTIAEWLPKAETAAGPITYIDVSKLTLAQSQVLIERRNGLCMKQPSIEELIGNKDV